MRNDLLKRVDVGPTGPWSHRALLDFLVSTRPPCGGRDDGVGTKEESK